MLDSVSRSVPRRPSAAHVGPHRPHVQRPHEVTAIRSAVYLAEQDCPIEEEFDGNDFVAAHFIGYVGEEPVACLRVRFFGDFAKVERLAVRHQYRRSVVAFELVKAASNTSSARAFARIYGQAQDRLVDFWAHFGAKPLPIRGRSLSPISLHRDGARDRAGRGCHHARRDPYVIIRLEGDSDTPGVLDRSKGRVWRRPASPTRGGLPCLRRYTFRPLPSLLICADLQRDEVTPILRPLR